MEPRDKCCVGCVTHIDAERWVGPVLAAPRGTLAPGELTRSLVCPVGNQMETNLGAWSPCGIIASTRQVSQPNMHWCHVPVPELGFGGAATQTVVTPRRSRAHGDAGTIP